MCKPVRMDPGVFAALHYLPLPVPGSDDHYKSFEEVYGESEASTDKYRPSLQQKKRKASSFSPSQQHVKNVGLVKNVTNGGCFAGINSLCKKWLTSKVFSMMYPTLVEPL